MTNLRIAAKADPLSALYKKWDELYGQGCLADENGLYQERDRYDEARSLVEDEIFPVAPTTDKTAVRKLQDVMRWSSGTPGIDDSVEQAIEEIESGVYDVRSVVATLKGLIPLAGMVDRETMNDGHPTVPLLRQVIAYLTRPKAVAGDSQASPPVAPVAPPKSMLEVLKRVVGEAA
jgi:hypothetical protein